MQSHLAEIVIFQTVVPMSSLSPAIFHASRYYPYIFLFHDSNYRGRLNYKEKKEESNVWKVLGSNTWMRQRRTGGCQHSIGRWQGSLNYSLHFIFSEMTLFKFLKYRDGHRPRDCPQETPWRDSSLGIDVLHLAHWTHHLRWLAREWYRRYKL